MSSAVQSSKMLCAALSLLLLLPALPGQLIERTEPPEDGVDIPRGTRVSLALINSVGAKNAKLEQGMQLKMVLDRDLEFAQGELTFDNPLAGPPPRAPQRPPSTDQNNGGLGLPNCLESNGL